MTKRFFLGCAPLLFLFACGESPEGEVPCSGDGDCTFPNLCIEGGCQLPDPVGVGEPCLAQEHCQSGLCLRLSTASGDQPARCVVECDDAAECDEGRCAPLVGHKAEVAGAASELHFSCQTTTGERHLGESCAQDADCEDGLCHAGECARPCSESCPAPMVCEQVILEREGASLEHGLCRYGAPLEVVELGGLDTPASMANEITFSIPEGVRSFVLMADDAQDTRVAIRRLLAPDGTVLVNTDAPESAVMRSGPYIGTGTAVVPGSDDERAAVQSGTYTAVVSTNDPQVFDHLEPMDGSVERVALIYRPAGVQAGEVDLNIHFAPATGISSATAATDAYLNAALARLGALYRKLAGVTLGEIRYFDLTGAEDTVDDGAAARAICSAFSDPGPHGRSVNFFLVQDFALAAGFAGGVGAPPGLYLRPGSGIVFARQPSANALGVLMAHELGHFLGLWHTTELTGGGDPMGDTPLCPSETAIRDCPDYRNLLFPRFPVDDPLVLSAGQRGVLRGSPWLAEKVYPDACSGRAAVDVSTTFFAGGDLEGESKLAGSCGGESHAERVHLLELDGERETLTVTINAPSFTPVVYLRHGGCAEVAQEIACEVGEGPAEELVVTVEAPAAGRYYVVVDGLDGEGFYTLDIAAPKVAPEV